MQFIYDIDTVELTRGVDFMCGCIYGLVGSHTCVSFIKVLKIIHSFHGYTRMARVQLG